LKLLRIIVSEINTRPILLKDIINFLEKNPNLVQINSGHQKDEGYIKSLEEDKKLVNQLNGDKN